MSGIDLHDCDIKVVDSENSDEYTLEYVQSCNTNDKLWVYSGVVIYDVTHFRKNHPGGINVFANRGGKDITKDLAYHTKRTRDSLFLYQVGFIKQEQETKNSCAIM